MHTSQHSWVRQAGFTLAELLVVMAIIVALAAIAVPIIVNQKDRADSAAMRSDVAVAGRLMTTAASTNGSVSVDPSGSQIVYTDPDGSPTTLVASKGVFTLHHMVSEQGQAGVGSCVQLHYETMTYSYSIPTGFAETPCAS